MINFQNLEFNFWQIILITSFIGLPTQIVLSGVNLLESDNLLLLNYRLNLYLLCDQLFYDLFPGTLKSKHLLPASI